MNSLITTLRFLETKLEGWEEQNFPAEDFDILVDLSRDASSDFERWLDGTEEEWTKDSEERWVRLVMESYEAIRYGMPTSGEVGILREAVKDWQETLDNEVS